MTRNAPRRVSGLLSHPWAGTTMLLIFYAVLLALFTAASPFFLSFSNISSIGTNMAFIGLMAAAGTPLIIAGGTGPLRGGRRGDVRHHRGAALRGSGSTSGSSCVVGPSRSARCSGAVNGVIVTKGRIEPLHRHPRHDVGRDRAVPGG